jgi:hypothetical protein
MGLTKPLVQWDPSSLFSGTHQASCSVGLTKPLVQWDPPSLLFSGYLRFFPGVKRPGCEVNHSPDLMLRLRMNGAMPPLPSPHNSSLRGLWRFDMIYLTAVGLKPGGSNTIHINAQTIHRTKQSTQTIRRKTQFTN